jgi:WD40 repeat protein
LSVAFSTDGKTLLSGSYDQTAIVWNLEQIFNLDLLQYACSLLRDYLQTNAELAHSDAYGTEEGAGRSLCTGVETPKAAQ